MNRIRVSGWIAATALLAGLPAVAEIFHSQDGVVFEGTLRKVVAQAAVCNVLEEKYTPAEYERLKPNHGRPLDLWQVDFEVRNESGRQIEHLRASAWVRAEHPPCTNWSGEGPGGGPVLPQPSLMVPIVWSDYFQMLQRADGMRPGERERRSFYLVVFGGQQPQFGEWDIDYRFAAEIGDASERGGTTQSGRGPQAPGPAFELPPEIQADRYLLQAEQAVREGDAAGVRAAMERLEALEREHGLEPALEGHFRYAQAWAAAGEPERAMESVVRYLRLGGREAEHYTEALELLNRAESGKLLPARVEPSCEGQAEGAECWKELASHPGCHVWDNHYYADQTVTWTGECNGGLASGTGTLTWVRDGKENKYTGLLRDGKEHGQWVLRFADGNVSEGPYVDGKRHGDWVMRDADGNTGEGPFVDGKHTGHWVVRRADGDVYEGPFVDGKANGDWVLRHAEGAVEKGPYVDDKKHGRWDVRYPNGRTEILTFVNGVEKTAGFCGLAIDEPVYIVIRVETGLGLLGYTCPWNGNASCGEIPRPSPSAFEQEARFATDAGGELHCEFTDIREQSRMTGTVYRFDMSSPRVRELLKNDAAAEDWYNRLARGAHGYVQELFGDVWSRENYEERIR